MAKKIDQLHEDTIEISRLRKEILRLDDKIERLQTALRQIALISLGAEAKS